MIEVILSQRDVNYIMESSYLLNVTQRMATSPCVGINLIDEILYEEIGDLLTEKLASIGFDLDYNVNDEGNFIESLIDKFSNR